MILIVTLNPLLEERLTFGKVLRGEVNRSTSSSFSAGGKGLNVSRQLKKMGINSFNFIFSGGTDGKVYRDILRKENINFASVQTESETRFASVIIEEDEQKVTSYFSPDPLITLKESDEFLMKLEKMIRNCEMVVFSGSSPRGAENIIPEAISIANKFDKVSVCDTYGVNLEVSLNAAPTLTHNNFEEIKSSLNLDLTGGDTLISLLNSFYAKGIKRAYLTSGPEPSYASNFDYIYRVFPPEVNAVDSTGSGDTFVAGIIYGWHHNLVFEDSLRFATALASLNTTSFDVSKVDPSKAEQLAVSVQIETVGKKIKTLNDLPH